MLKDQPLRRSIIASIIASVLFIAFIQPILRFIWLLISGFSAACYTGFVDTLYRTSALGHRNDIDVQIFAMALAIIIGSATGFIIVVSPRKLVEKISAAVPGRGKTILMSLASVCVIICAIISLTYSFVDLQLNTSFQQQLTVLSPSITDMQYKELKAAWSSMRSKRDYDALQSRLEQLAKDNNIILPPLLL